jgi:hypothetical protein
MWVGKGVIMILQGEVKLKVVGSLEIEIRVGEGQCRIIEGVNLECTPKRFLLEVLLGLKLDQ